LNDGWGWIYTQNLLSKSMKIAFFYDSLSSHIGTVWDHCAEFGKADTVDVDFFPVRNQSGIFLKAPTSGYDWIVCHYSVRLPIDYFENFLDSLVYSPLSKALFIQDEYDNVEKTRKWIERIQFKAVFTCVPHNSIPIIYPSERFPNTNFISVLTGYVPKWAEEKHSWTDHGRRKNDVGYRGRRLPFRYGALGQMKYNVGEYFKDKNVSFNIDISSQEELRIYGDKWPEFLEDCRCVLGSESGANLFDWDGSLACREAEYLKQYPSASFAEFQRDVIQGSELISVMNQISPRIFEAIGTKTALVLYDGNYSGVIERYKHFFPIAHDYSNWDQVSKFISDRDAVQEMAERTYKDIISSQKFGYSEFVSYVISCLKKYQPNRLVDHLSVVCCNSNTRDISFSDMFSLMPLKHPLSSFQINQISALLFDFTQIANLKDPIQLRCNCKELQIAFGYLIIARVIYFVQIKILKHYRPDVPRILAGKLFSESFRHNIKNRLDLIHRGWFC
jgi:hypothetical protein